MTCQWKITHRHLFKYVYYLCVCVCLGCGDNDVFADLVIQEEVEEPEEQESGRFTLMVFASATFHCVMLLYSLHHSVR